MITKENKYLIYDKPKCINVKYLIKRLLNYIDRIRYKVQYLLYRPQKKQRNYKYNVSICAIFKDEADYMKEWIEFHKIVGVEHFYLYNNNSSDNYYEILKPYIDEGIVSLKDWPKPQSQMAAYEDFMNTQKEETKWVGFIDLDEYVVPNDENNIYDILKKYDNSRPVILIYWKYFGTTGKKNRDINGLITEDFVISWDKYADIGKFFFNTKYDYIPDYKKNGFMHYMWAGCGRKKLPPVNVFNKVCTWGNNPVCGKRMPMQINHYVIKSFDEYTQKKARRGGGVHPIGMHDYDYFYEHEMKCCDTDFHIYKYLIKLKLAMEGETK